MIAGECSESFLSIIDNLSWNGLSSKRKYDYPDAKRWPIEKQGGAESDNVISKIKYKCFDFVDLKNYELFILCFSLIMKSFTNPIVLSIKCRDIEDPCRSIPDHFQILIKNVVLLKNMFILTKNKK
jgi:hypothetical protein